MLKSLKNAMDHRHKKKPGDQGTGSSSTVSSSGRSSSIASEAAQPGLSSLNIAPKTFERRASAEPNVGNRIPPKMPKTPDPIISEPDSPVPMMKSRFASTDLLSNNRAQSPLIERSTSQQPPNNNNAYFDRSVTYFHPKNAMSNPSVLDAKHVDMTVQNVVQGSPIVQRSSHQTSSRSVMVQQQRHYQEIVDGPNGRQVRNFSDSRRDDHSKQSQIQSTEVNGEVKVEADHQVSSTSAAKATIEAMDTMGQSLRQACAALSHSSNKTSSSFAGDLSGMGELSQTSQTDTYGFQGEQQPDGNFRGTTYQNSVNGTPIKQSLSTSELLDHFENATPKAIKNEMRKTLMQMLETFETAGNSTTTQNQLQHKINDDGIVDLLIDNVDSGDQEVSVLSTRVLDKCMDMEARDKILKKGVDGIVRVATIKGNAESRRAGTGVLGKIMNNSEMACNEVVKNGGLDAVLEACKSQDLETQRSSALALLNLSLYGGQFNQHQMIKQRAQDWLFPLAFGQSDKQTKYSACLCVGTLIANKELEAAVVKSGTLDLVNEFVTDNQPEIFATVYAELLDPKQSRDVMTRLIPSLDSHILEAQQLAAFHFATEAHARKKKNDFKIFRELGIIEHLKACASSPNDIASRFAAECLSLLGETVPHRLTQQSPLWTLQDVKHWLQQIGFSKETKVFTENEVDGDVLLQLTDIMLSEDLKMHSRLQRHRFLRVLQQLKRISDYASCDPFNIHSFLLQIAPEYAQYTYNLLKAGIDPSVFPFITDDHLKYDAKIENGVHRAKILDAIRRRHSLEKGAVMEVRSENDVFISYRRATGSQLASLLKVHLQLRGFSVFIDIDKLDAGAFDQKLIDSVRMAKHFVLILSPTALDRCIGDDDKKDWIHKEISAAISCKCNIVPITDPQFSWPTPEILPEDMRSICRFNGIRWIHDYQDACVDKLERFLRGDLNTKPSSVPSQSSSQQGHPQSLPAAISYHGAGASAF